MEQGHRLTLQCQNGSFFQSFKNCLVSPLLNTQSSLQGFDSSFRALALKIRPLSALSQCSCTSCNLLFLDRYVDCHAERKTPQGSYGPLRVDSNQLLGFELVAQCIALTFHVSQMSQIRDGRKCIRSVSGVQVRSMRTIGIVQRRMVRAQGVKHGAVRHG